MPFSSRVSSLRSCAGRRLWSSLLLAAFALVASIGGVPADERVTKYLVQVRLPSLESVRELAAAGFDVAGVNANELLAGVVATDDELKRLAVLGWSYTAERSNADALSIAALSDYTDPQELSAYMDQVVAAHPDLAQKIALTSPLYEGQVQYALKITKDVGLENDRPSFILDAQHHAREVMTPEIARDMIDYLTTRYDG